MIFVGIAIFVVSVLGKSPIDLEISEVEDLLQKYSTARSVLQSKKHTNDLTPIEVSLNGDEWLLSKLIPRFHIVYEKPVVSVQFITLKPVGAFRDTANSVNVALVVGYADGQIDVLQHTGEVLCSYTLSYTPLLLATTSTSDEIKIATISPTLTIDIFDFSIEKVKKSKETDSNSPQTFRIVPESSDRLLCENPTSVTFYSKTGKKFWIVGDEAGDLNFHLFNGTFFKKTETKLGKITALEKYGQTLVFSTVTSVGVINPSTLEILTVCNDIGHVYDICIDSLSSLSYVFALTADKLFVLDSKYTLNKETFCKVIGNRSVEDNPKALTCARNYIVTWGDLKAKLHNTTFHFNEGYQDVFEITTASGQEKHLESHKIQTGGTLFLISSEKEVFMYEVVLPYKTAPPFDFGNIRFIVIILAIGGALLWQYYRKGSGNSGNAPASKSRKYNMPRSIPKRRK